MRETNESFDSCKSCKRLVPTRLHDLHESKLSFVSRIEFIRSKLSNFSAHVSGPMSAERRCPAIWVGGPRSVPGLSSLVTPFTYAIENGVLE